MVHCGAETLRMEGRAGREPRVSRLSVSMLSPNLLLVVSGAVPAASPIWCATGAPCAPAELDVDEENSLVHLTFDTWSLTLPLLATS